MKNLTNIKPLQHTLNGIYDAAILRSAGVPVRQANDIGLDGNFHDLKANRSFCCFAPIENGYCSYCGIECDNLL